jgi:dihydroorotase
MKILLQNVQIISPGSRHHLKIKDVLIEENLIIEINKAGTINADDARLITGNSYSISPGWFDLHSNFCEPGEEFKEDIASGCSAAMQGGFTGVLLMPSTTPPVSGRPSVEYIIKRASDQLVDVKVAGTISKNLEGKDLSEMYDMFLAGTRVFTDDKRPVQDAGLMTRALQYSQNFGGKIFSFSEDKYLAGKGQIHEGNISTRLGIKGIPSVAEEIMINRDLLLSLYTNAPIHFSTISTLEGVALIRKAKAQGLKVTADVSAMHLLLDESSVQSFDSNFKVNPPLRSIEDRKALIEGLADGTIDCICSDHIPQNPENKEKEFELAAYGATGLETAFGVARTATLNKISLPELISKFTSHPRCCAGLKPGLIEENQPADITVFDPDSRWIVIEHHLLSKSRNNPFTGRELTGKPVAVLNKGKLEYCK